VSHLIHFVEYSTILHQLVINSLKSGKKLADYCTQKHPKITPKSVVVYGRKLLGNIFVGG